MYVSPNTDALPHEPVRVRAAAPVFALRLLVKLVLVAVLGAIVLPLWPLFAVGALVFGWPPHVARPAEFARYFGLVLTARPPSPGIPPLSRAYLFAHLVQRLWMVPVAGAAWYLDEVLLARRMAAHPIHAPVIVLSAARSGSTQISRYLEEDPRLAAPSSLQTLVPYLWLWHLARPLGRWITEARLEAWLRATMPLEFIQRHEVHPLRTDTFEVLFFVLRVHVLAPCFGPETFVDDMAFSSRAAHNRRMWERDFVGFIDRLGRKTLAFAGLGPDGRPRRLYIKGHFQAADDALAARYPDAHFLTVTRDPVKRLRSVLNHIHGNPIFEPLGAIPWAWLAEALPDAAAAYDAREHAWFTRPDGPARTVIRFTAYAQDLEGTMRTIYRRCFGDEQLPDHVPRVHTARDRTNYAVNRSLADVGIDADAHAARSAQYIAWLSRPGSPDVATGEDA